MSTASQVVAIQAHLLDQFHTPHPDHPGHMQGMAMGDGGDMRVPRSQMGDLIDLMARKGQAVDAPTIAPSVAVGLTIGRTYRVQENMSAPIAARADALPATTRIFDDVRPPTKCGFAWLDEPVPHDVRNLDDAPGYSAISWTCAVDDADDPTSLIYVVTFWADMHHRTWHDWHPDDRALIAQAVPKLRSCPLGVQILTAGQRIGPATLHVDWDQQLSDMAAGRDSVQSRSPRHIVAALWQMLGETLPAHGGATERVEQADEDIDNRTRRAARRAGIEGPAVTTVVLRRQSCPTRHPGTGTPWDSRVWIEPFEAWRWIGSGANRRRVRRTIAGHWSVANEALPVRHRKIVSELRR